MAKISLKTSHRQKKNKFDVSSTHVLTHDVGQLRPVNILPATGGDSFDINFNSFSRLAPLVAPTFGSFRMKYYAFFVPYRLIWNGYEEYISRSADATIPHPTLDVTVSSLFKMLFGAQYDATDNIVVPSGVMDLSEQFDINSKNFADAKNYDFCFYYKQGPNVMKAYNLNSKGRWFYNILVSLGYEIPHRLTFDSNGTDFFVRETYSLLPLLAFGRCLYDYVYPSAYVQQQGFGYLFEPSVVDEDPLDVLGSLIDLMFVPYDQNFYTSLWSKSNSVATNSQSSLIGDLPVAQGGTSYQNTLNSDPEDSRVVLDSSTSMTANALRWLEALSDFVTRNNIGGTRFGEWLKSHRGFVTNEQRITNMSTFIKSWSNDLMISDVTALTGTSTQVLGEQAGKAVCQAGGSVKFDAPEDGLLIFMSMVTPRTCFYQGLKPWCKKINSSFDFYTEEFDSVGMEPIAKKELFASYDSYTGSHPVVAIQNRDGVFGFAPRYANMYKHGFDYLSGDFRLASRNANLSSYHTFRDLEEDREGMPGNELPIALDAHFMSVGNQYNRIFASDPTDGDGTSIYDKILSICRFDVTKHSSMASIGESLPLFHKDGQETNVQYEGNQL